MKYLKAFGIGIFMMILMKVLNELIIYTIPDFIIAWFSACAYWVSFNHFNDQQK